MSNPAIKEQLQRLLKELDRDTEGASPTLAELWPSYWATEGQHLESAARTQDAWNVLGPVVGADGIALKDRQALAVTADVIEEVREQVKQTQTRFRRPPKPATMNRHLIVLRRVLNWAVEQRKLPYNPLRLSLEKENNVRQTAIKTEEEFQRLLTCCDPL
ncbi:MAG TPA: hypothetical protein VIV60_21545, partial [Polyangiaceae bacterium]